MNSQNSVLSYAETILLQKILKYSPLKRQLNYLLKKIYLTYITISTIYGN